MKCLRWKQSNPRKNSKSALCLWQHYSLTECPLSRGPTGIVSAHCCWCTSGGFPPRLSLQSDRLGAVVCLPSAEMYLSVPHPFRPLIWTVGWSDRCHFDGMSEEAACFWAPLALLRTACSLRSLLGIIKEGNTWNQITALWERGFWTRPTHVGKWKFHSFFKKKTNICWTAANYQALC